MKDLEYIVLRSETLLPPEAASVGAPEFHAFGGRSGASAGSFEVFTESLSKAQRDDLRRDPRTRAIASSMPLKLIEPKETKAVGPEASSSGVAWGIDAVGASASAFDGTGIKVAVLDTGIDPAHAAFAGMNLVRRNFTTEGDDDTHGHGTHCAGTIFGRDVDNTRIGVAPGVTDAIIGKVLGQGGGGSGDLVKAIRWASEEGANVVSMSLGIDFPGFVKDLENAGLETEPATSIALEQYRANVNLFSSVADLLASLSAVQHATLIVAASGNESDRPDYEIAVAPPAAGTGLLSVGALAKGGAAGHEVADFSNTQCDVSGPGVNVASAKVGGGLVSMSGTSMATPHVAGVAALWAQKQVAESGGVRSDVLAAQLIAHADRAPLVANSERDDVGQGIVQAP